MSRSAGKALPPAILIGGRVNALSAARTLGRYGVPVYTLPDRGDRGPVASRYVEAFPGWPPVDDGRPILEQWLGCLEERTEVLSGAALIPCSDDALELIALHRTGLAEAGYRPAEAKDEAVLDMLDKGRTYELARKAKVPAPHTTTVASIEELLDAVDEFSFPCALKPIHSHRFQRHFTAKAFVASTREELTSRYMSIAGTGLEMLLTEIVPGVDDEFCSYYTYLDESGTPLLTFTKRKLRQYPIGFGLGTYHVTKWEPEAAEFGLRFARMAGLVGMVNIEFKRDARDGELKLIECNVRLTGSNEVARRSGVDFARIIYDRAIGHPGEFPVTFREEVYEWHPFGDFQAFRQYRAAGQLDTRRWLRSLIHPHLSVPELALDDPYPVLSKTLRCLRRER